MTATLTQRIADYVCGEEFERLDPAVVQRSKQILTYHIGLACRATREKHPDAIKAVTIAQDLSGNCGNATLIGYAQRVTLVEAVFANCSMMRALGLDDVIFPAGIHSGLMTVPVALGVGERHQVSGADLITAVVAGYEVMGKVGQFSWAFDPPRRPTQLFGPFGSITTAAKLLGLDHEQTIVALAYAAHTAMGLAENDLGPVSHWYSLICRNAIIGAYSSRAGAWGSPTVIEGRYGFADAFLGGREIDVDAVVDQLGDDYMVMNSCEKRYPGTTLNQIPIELMRKLVIDDGIRADDVARVRITFPEERRQFSAGHELGPIANSGLAASSFAFQCAMLLLDGKQDPARYEDFRDPAILDVLDRMAVDFVPDKPVRYTRIELETTSGERFVKEGDDFQFSPDQTRLVLERDGAGVLPDKNIERAIELLDDFENVADVRELTTVLAA